jgi:hypothetical protein
VRYFLHDSDLQIGFADGEVYFQAIQGQPHEDMQGHMSARRAAGQVSLRLELSQRRVQPRGMGLMESYTNYYIGRPMERWRTHVAHYERLLYPEIYPGIDLVYFFDDRGQLTTF